MVDTLHPVNAVAGAPSYSGRMLRQARSAAYAGATAARPLGARSGVRPGTSKDTVTATSTTWTCGPFAGIADVEAVAQAGPYEFAFDANATGAVVAQDATYPRSDLIYVQIDDPSEGDGSTIPAVTRKYIVGTPSATPADPTLPVTRAFAVARINNLKAGSGAPTVTWIAPYAVAAGGVLPFNTVAELNLYTTAPQGQHAHVFDTGSDYIWTGAGWRKVPVGRLGVNRRVADAPLSDAWTDVCTVTATSFGGSCSADWTMRFVNGASGADRTLNTRVVCDGNLIGAEVLYNAPLANGTTGLSAAFSSESVPGAGSHVWKLQAAGVGTANALIAKQAVLTVTEY
jgi:hypothetical protein